MTLMEKIKKEKNNSILICSKIMKKDFGTKQEPNEREVITTEVAVKNNNGEVFRFFTGTIGIYNDNELLIRKFTIGDNSGKSTDGYEEMKEIVTNSLKQ